MITRIPKPDIVLFDMDGTIVQHLNPFLFNIVEKLDDFYYSISSFFKGHPKIENVEKDALEHPPGPFSARMMFHWAIHRIRRKDVNKIVRLSPDLKKLLALLKNKNIPMAVASNSLGHGYGHDILRTFEIEDYFFTTVFNEDYARAKPHPDPLIRALKALPEPLKGNEVIWVIGDRRKDIVAAKNLDLALYERLPELQIVPLAYGIGTATIAIFEHNYSKEYIIPNYHDLLNKIKG